MAISLPSIWTCLSVAFVTYMSYNVYQLYGLYVPTSCSKSTDDCLESYLSRENVKLQKKLVGFISVTTTPRIRVLEWNGYNTCNVWWQLIDLHRKILRVYTSRSEKLRSDSQLKELLVVEDLDPFEIFSRNVSVDVPNKSLFAFVFVVPAGSPSLNEAKWKVSASASLTQLAMPEAATFQLIGDAQVTQQSQPDKNQMVMHLRSLLALNVMTTPFGFHRHEVLPDLYGFLRMLNNNEYLPILFIDQMSWRAKDLKPLNKSAKVMQLTIAYQPISVGKLRLFNAMSASLGQLTAMGFTDKEIDDVKGLFMDTNIYLLMLTMIISVCHLLFDFLAFKNDISFWRNRENIAGLSSKAVIWRCVSTTIIFLYLMDQKTSYLVLVPMGISACIEYWKTCKALKIQITRSGIKMGASSKSEQETEAFDDEAMRWLNYGLIPLCIAGSAYSLMYTPQRSWYSWLVQSLANGVYAFGFIFMLPQLYINYKLKSVAHLPWRAFTYKAFNTFIDDVFAFIITMPTSHRIAVFRDDLVFLIYLFQRWLYQVDKTRVNEFGQSFDDKTPSNAKAKASFPCNAKAEASSQLSDSTSFDANIEALSQLLNDETAGDVLNTESLSKSLDDATESDTKKNQ